MQICGCDHSGGIHRQPFYGSGRSMACVLDHGGCYGGDLIYGVSERCEGIAEIKNHGATVFLMHKYNIV